MTEYEGKQDKIRSMKLPKIDVFENIYSDKSFRVVLEFDEFVAICPKTGLPDMGHIKIIYYPNQYCIELKSLKLYFVAYRNVGIFHENVLNRMLDDIEEVCSPHSIQIEIEYRNRGGIITTVSGERHEECV